MRGGQGHCESLCCRHLTCTGGVLLFGFKEEIASESLSNSHWKDSSIVRVIQGTFVYHTHYNTYSNIAVLLS